MGYNAIMTTGELIRARRESLGLTKYAAAKSSDLPIRTWYWAETGANNTTVDTLEKIAARLGCEIGDLFPRSTAENK